MPPSGSELSLIEAISSRLQAHGPRVIASIGDDAAVVRGAPVCLTSVDAIVEGVHFELGAGRYSHADVGYKALGSALSDIAAMGAGPGEAYLTLALPTGTSEADALAIVDGALELAREAGVSLIGGDVVSAPTLSVCVTVVGWAQLEQRIVYRSGAGEGDLVGVTGELGLAGAGLACMQGRAVLAPAHAQAALSKSLRPSPRLREGAALAAAGASAMIDLSDGLAIDAAHVGRASGMSLAIDLAALPVSEAVSEAAAQLHVPSWQLAASAGEDYELCVCVPRSRRQQAERALREVGGADVTWVGRVRKAGARGAGASFRIDGEQPELRGFEHRW